MPSPWATTLALASLVPLVSACLREFSNLVPRHTHRKPVVRRNEPEAWPPVLTKHETILINSFDNNSIDDWANYYGHQVKLAGLGKEAAEWTRDRWAESGFDSKLVEYHVYLSYPVHQSLAVTFANGTTAEVTIQEEGLPEDDVTNRKDSIPTFHGYSASGNVSAEYVYVGFVDLSRCLALQCQLTKRRRGTGADFERLVDLGVDLKGKIALIRYGSIFRGLKVKNAQDHGMIGAVIFTDLADDGNITVAKGYKAYPGENSPSQF